MSYSFQIKEATKAAAKHAVTVKVFDIAATQPIHQRDRDAIEANAHAVIDLLADDDTKDVAVSCNGYLSWNGAGGSFDPATAPVCNAAISCTASHAGREA
jgi:hypothetical protein